jgi:UDP-glucose:(heptosyl)LPS alpha-1,3-glucosyltransferase
MRIAIIRKRYTFHGGSEGYSEILVRKLSECGHEVHIFAIEWTKKKGGPNIHFHRVPVVRFNSFLRDLSFAVSSFFILRKKKDYFDIIQSHDKTIYQDIYRAGDGCHIEWLKQRWKREGLIGKMSIMFNPYHWLILTIERFIFRHHRFKVVIAISEMVKRNMIENYGINPSDISVIYNGVDLKRFNPETRDRFRHEIRSRYRIREDEFVLLFVGSGFKRKGLGYLLESIESVDKPLTLMVVGKGRFKQVAGHQKVIFCGPQKDIHKYYAAADIFVFPTVYEPFGNVHLEALASGLPVITTSHSGAAEIIEDERQGFIIEDPEDIEKMAERIKQLMDQEAREKRGIEARRLAERFSIESHIEELMALYQSVKR